MTNIVFPLEPGRAYLHFFFPVLCPSSTLMAKYTCWGKKKRERKKIVWKKKLSPNEESGKAPWKAWIYKHTWRKNNFVIDRAMVEVNSTPQKQKPRS